MGRTPQENVGGVLISLSRPWARRWINHLSLWRMASATPDLRLPSQPQGIAALDRYQIILLGDRGRRVWTTCPRLLLQSGTAGVEPATFCVASQRPNYYTSETPPGGHNMLRHRTKCNLLRGTPVRRYRRATAGCDRRSAAEPTWWGDRATEQSHRVGTVVKVLGTSGHSSPDPCDPVGDGYQSSSRSADLQTQLVNVNSVVRVPTGPITSAATTTTFP